MIVFDENIPKEERILLAAWGIRGRVIGVEVGAIGTSDENVLVVLRRLKSPTFFTRDIDFFDQQRKIGRAHV